MNKNKTRHKIVSYLLFIIGFNTCLIAQISFDVSAGLARNKSPFAYYRFNNNGGYHQNFVYPIYHTESFNPYTTSPLLAIGLNTEKSSFFNLRLGFSTGIYKENVDYVFKENEHGYGHFTRTIIEGEGFIRQPYMRFEISPTIQIRKFRLILPLITIEKLTNIVDAKIKAKQTTYDVYTKAKIPGMYNYPEDSIVTYLGQESITINDPKLHSGIEGHRTLFFPIKIGLEYECLFNRNIIVFGFSALVSYSQSYAATPHSSYMFYASYRFRKKKEKVESNNNAMN